MSSATPASVAMRPPISGGRRGGEGPGVLDRPSIGDHEGATAVPPARKPGLEEAVTRSSSQEDLVPPQKREPSKRDVVVIGAGPAGLTAAYALTKRGEPVTVL